ncbi:two-component system, NtrC family, C4-dicarboxylate transport response regulator DctD [Atopomonas hussainii]|uniref:Two-component system, NtrC family, C4-dicarboxylate transport response regulator DctD n=1 Tax=Atopomonas hussainii TaxID=1429083 RepID=A0A1H7NVX9_9GAMM|nr:sigma-54 dependent transcriptional regulator [Atopomonas hussainii]SEL27713.1 two-component system, NtrC family, C4-dicarboxylate transport response regulator DctD [Atopomonas hussainii]
MTPIDRVLLIDDDPDLRRALTQTLELAGFSVESRGSAEGLLAQLDHMDLGVIVSDIRMSGMDGMQLLGALQQRDPALPVILITGHGDIALAVEAMKNGAFDFLEKPFASEQLVDRVKRALEQRALVLENRQLRLQLAEQSGLGARLIGQSAGMQRLRQQLGALAATHADVLILGETGTGKEVVARALHDLSPRRAAPFVAINAGALAESVVESELFGHEPGAFTGANKRRIGKFEFANGGTVFLDEIESMTLEVQVKLLRLLQERAVERVGGNQLIALDIRIIAASKEDLRQAADEGRFRADLYYRLNVAALAIPPLKQRGDDILLLFKHFGQRAAERYQLALPELNAAERAALLGHDWPGNVRELQNCAERFALGLGLVIGSHSAPELPTADGQGLAARVEAFEKALIETELLRGHNSLKAMAEALNIPRKTLHDKLRKHGLQFADED